MGEIATQQLIETSRKDPYAPNDKERRIHYSYTRRSGWCTHPKHKRKRSSKFHGVNEKGWMFECHYAELDTHYFVNEPPSGAE